MDNIKKTLTINTRKYGILLSLIVISIFFAIATKGLMLKPLNISNLILQNSYILILAIGMLIIIVMGHIDLSVGSVVAFIGALMGYMTEIWHWNPYISMLSLILIGAIIGAWHGMWVSVFKIPAFVVTLGGMLIFRGLALVLLGGSTLGPFPDQIAIISSGFIPGVRGAYNITAIAVGIVLSILYAINEIIKRRSGLKYGHDVTPLHLNILKILGFVIVINGFTFLLASYKGLPNVLILVAFLGVLYSFITTRTVIGRRIYATGGNPDAAKLSGINTNRLTFMAFVNMGVLCAISAIVFTARLNSANSRAGTGFELDAIAACVIGGTSFTGGIGTVPGVFIGTLVMGILNNGMSLLGIGIDWQQVIKGLILTFAVFFDIYTKRKSN
ncbi:MAG: multiple monosaccharide ABC transporter permease [Actinomycetota bacterium]